MPEFARKGLEEVGAYIVRIRPVFQNSKVLLWSGNILSTRGKHPGTKIGAIKNAIDFILSHPDFMKKLSEKTAGDDFYLYGIGIFGKLLICLNRGELAIKRVCDKFSNLQKWRKISIMKVDYCYRKTGIILVTVYDSYDEIKQNLIQKGFVGEIVDLHKVLKEEEVCEKL